MLAILKNRLKAALSHAGDGDVRSYLNGVHIEITTCGDMHIVATDGHRAFIGRVAASDVAWTAEPHKGPFTLTIPRATVKAAIAERLDALYMHAMPDGRYTLGNQVFTPCDGRFPDWRRIIPRDPNGEAADFNWSYLAGAQASLNLWQGTKLARCRLTMNGSGAALVESYDENAFVVVMPIGPRRDKEHAIIGRFRPASL